MKCKYCNAEVAPNARFCTSCGGDLSKFNKCIKCGNFIEKDVSVCPHCGTEQPHQEEKGEASSKKWIWIVAFLCILLIGGAAWFYLSDREFFGKDNTKAEAVDSDSITYDSNVDIHSVEGIKNRVNEIFSNALSMSDEDAINRFFSKEYRELFAKVKQQDSAHPDDIGFWCGNIWDGGQDGNPNGFLVNSVHPSTETNALAEVKLTYDEGDYHSENLQTVELVFENDNWFINNINGFKQSMGEYVQGEGEQSEEIVNGYIQKVTEKAKSGSYSCDYFLYDINNDGISELWILSGTCEADMELNVFAQDLELIFHNGASHSSFYKGDSYILQVGAMMGQAAWTKLYYSEGKIQEKVIFEEDTTKTGADYTEPKESEVTLISYENLQPIKQVFNVN